jgi:excisionase family DNA binding protein
VRLDQRAFSRAGDGVQSYPAEGESRAMTQQFDTAEKFDTAQTRFLTVGEVARLLRVSTMTVYRLINAGRLPAVRIGRSFRLRAVDIDRYVTEQLTRAG